MEVFEVVLLVMAVALAGIAIQLHGLREQMSQFSRMSKGELYWAVEQGKENTDRLIAQSERVIEQLKRLDNSLAEVYDKIPETEEYRKKLQEEYERALADK